MRSRRSHLAEVISERELVKRSSEGDADAFRQLAREHRGLIEAACASVILDRTDREDAIQVALTDIWRGLGGFEGAASLSTWMYRVARNAAVRHSSRKAGQKEEPVEHIVEVSPTEDGWDEASATRDLVLRVLERLPDDQRDALLLHTQAGLPLKEIAELKMAAEGTIKSWIHRARAEIARELAASI
jgi:RNA polymerase sigma-70 factor (ECF subfamily)